MLCCVSAAPVAPFDTGPLRERLRSASKAYLGIQLAFIVSATGEIMCVDGPFARVDHFTGGMRAPGHRKLHEPRALKAHMRARLQSE